MKGVGSLRGRLRAMAGRHGERLYGSIGAQVSVARQAAELSRALVRFELPSDEARTQMTGLEHLGDEHRAALVLGMTNTLVTPIDREDLFRLSRAIDDVLDALRDFVREFDMFEAVPICSMEPLLEPIHGGLGELDLAIRTLRDQPQEAFSVSLRTKKRAGNVRQAYQEVLAEVLRTQPFDIAMFKNLELLRRLDAAGLSLHDAADALADGALKRVT